MNDQQPPAPGTNWPPPPGTNWPPPPGTNWPPPSGPIPGSGSGGTQKPSGAVAVVAAVLVGVGIVPAAIVGPIVGWGREQLVLATGSGSVSVWMWPVIALITATLVGGPAVLLALLPRSAAVRTTARAWLTATGAGSAMMLLRLVPAVQHELYLALLTLLAGGFGLALHLWARRSDDPATPRGSADRRADEPMAPRGSATRWGDAAQGLAVAAGIAVTVPWLWVGALGGLLETMLAVTAATAVGWLAAGILNETFWQAYATSPVRLIMLGGTVAGTVLLLLAAGTGQSGVQLASLLVLPPLGYAGAALHAVRRRARLASPSGDEQPPPEADSSAGSVPAKGPGGTAPVGPLVAIAALGPLGFVDPQEVTLLLATDRDVPAWTALAAFASWGIALLVGLGYAVGLARRRGPVLRTRVGAVAAGALLIAGAVVYVGPGQPGLFGERLFVVLKAQADLTGLAVPDTATGIDPGTGDGAGRTGQAGRDARATEVYRRLVATATSSQAALRRTLDRAHLTYTPFYLVNGIEVSGGPGIRAWLAARDDVDRVLVDQRLRPLVTPPSVSRGDITQPPTTPRWNITQIGADRVRTGLGVDGRGIVVGTSDSGVDGNHPALRGSFRGGDDSWYDPWNATRAPVDGGGHGTHTIGSAVGALNVGVAPGAQWTACVNLARNLGSPARYLDCLQFMLAPFPYGGDPFTDGRPARGPQVLTNSWGCPTIEGCDAGALRQATAAFAAAGTFFVAAAGNSGSACSSVDDSPATYPDVLSVGAVDERGNVTDFSSRGPAPDGTVKPDVMAPGAGVLSALPGGTYGTEDGTSMAAPHVAGVVALMWSANPALIGDPARTRRILSETATPVPVAGVGCDGAANVVGAGRVDAYAAVRAAQAAK